MNTADLEHVMLPDFVIIGAMKAASTLITECLRQHPEVYMPRGETPYFRDPEYSWSGIEIVEGIFAGQPEATPWHQEPGLPRGAVLRSQDS